MSRMALTSGLEWCNGSGHGQTVEQKEQGNREMKREIVGLNDAMD
jgi:hypothetical protein